VKNEFEGCGRKRLLSVLRHYSDVSLDVLGRLQESAAQQDTGKKLNARYRGYKAGVKTTQPQIGK
jgi:hypothetical protein